MSSKVCFSLLSAKGQHTSSQWVEMSLHSAEVWRFKDTEPAKHPKYGRRSFVQKYDCQWATSYVPQARMLCLSLRAMLTACSIVVHLVKQRSVVIEHFEMCAQRKCKQKYHSWLAHTPRYWQVIHDLFDLRLYRFLDLHCLQFNSFAGKSTDAEKVEPSTHPVAPRVAFYGCRSLFFSVFHIK